MNAGTDPRAALVSCVHCVVLTEHCNDCAGMEDDRGAEDSASRFVVPDEMFGGAGVPAGHAFGGRIVVSPRGVCGWSATVTMHDTSIGTERMVWARTRRGALRRAVRVVREHNRARRMGRA